MTKQDFEIENDFAVYDSVVSDSMNKITFTFENDEDLVISWKDGKIDISFTEDKMTDAGKAFFDWLKQHIEQNYELVPKR